MKALLEELKRTSEEWMNRNEKKIEGFEAALQKMNRLSLGGGGTLPEGDSAPFAVTVAGQRIPVLARGEKLSARFPRPTGSEGEWSIGDFVRASMGQKTINAVATGVERGTSLVPLFIANDIIDAVREKTRLIQAGAITIPIDGKTNICRVASDATVIEHTEGADDVTESFPVFEAVAMDPKMLISRIPLSAEVVMDSPNLDAALRTSIAAGFALKLDQLGIAKILADTAIPTSLANHACGTWGGVLTAIGVALAADQDIPKALIAGPADYMARVGQLASTSGNYLGAPAALQGMLDLPTGGMTDGVAVFGDFSKGVGIAVRSELSVELVRWQKPGFGSHVLIAYARMAAYVLQPKVLFHQINTV